MWCYKCYVLNGDNGLGNTSIIHWLPTKRVSGGVMPGPSCDWHFSGWGLDMGNVLWAGREILGRELAAKIWSDR